MSGPIAQQTSGTTGTCMASTYHDRCHCAGLRRSSRRYAPGCGAFRIASRDTTSGCCMVTAQAITPPQSWPTSAAVGDPRWPINARTSATSCRSR